MPNYYEIDSEFEMRMVVTCIRFEKRVSLVFRKEEKKWLAGNRHDVVSRGLRKNAYEKPEPLRKSVAHNP